MKPPSNFGGIPCLTAGLSPPCSLDLKNGTYRIISFYAKKARGLMIAWTVRNHIEDPKQLNGFNVAGYRYSHEL